MDDRRSFLKNTAVFGGLVLSPLGLYWPLESPVGGGIIQGGLGTLAGFVYGALVVGCLAG